MVKALELILNLVIYNISGIEFCADTKTVVAILKPDELSYTTDAEQTIPMLIRDNREFLFLDLRKTFNLQNEKFTTDTRVILMELNNNGLLFVVDKVVEIISSDTEFPFVRDEETKSREFIESVLIYEERRIILPDYNKIFWQAKGS